MRFVLRGSPERSFHGQHSATGIEIRGTWNLSGLQPVGEGGVPKVIADMFDSDESIMQIAIGREDSGVVYSRLKEE